METSLVPIEPRSFDEAKSFAGALAEANNLPAALRGKPADVLMSILAGRELGMAPMAAIRGIHIIEGKPTLAADAMVGLILRQPVCKYFRLVESSDRVATYETLREGHSSPTRMSITFAQAQRAGLTNKSNWKNWPEAMLRARCSAHLARAVYPDVLAGVYDPDEVQADAPREERSVGPQAPAVRVAPEPAPVVDAEVVVPEPAPAAPPPPAPADEVLTAIAAAADRAALDGLVDAVKADPALMAVRRKAWIDRATALQAKAA